MADLELDRVYCKKCDRTKRPQEFYTSNNTQKYPQGKVDMCKDCMTMHLDNFDPNTFLWILEELDIPYVPKVWFDLVKKWGKDDPSKLKSTSIMGRYISAMKLKQWRDYRWKDNEHIQKTEEARTEDAMKRQGYSAAEIAETLSNSASGVDLESLRPPGPIVEAPPQEDYFADQVDIHLELDLTDEDRRYLCLKWGKAYKPEEWITLEQFYQDMCQSYDIQTAGHIDTLKMICKTSLKANQLLDIGDVDGAQKMIKTYDSLMKSGKFTAAQNKAESGEYVDCISELVQICEADGFIPRYYTDGPQDKVDKVIIDTQHYVHELVTKEMGLGNLIENAFKLLAQEQESIRLASEIDDDEEDDLMDYEKSVVEVTEDDYDEFNDFKDSLENEDSSLLVEEEDD